MNACVSKQSALAGDADFLANDIRVKKGLDGLGCLGDMGWYTVRAALWAYGFEKPVSVSAHAGERYNHVAESQHPTFCSRNHIVSAIASQRHSVFLRTLCMNKLQIDTSIHEKLAYLL